MKNLAGMEEVHFDLSEKLIKIEVEAEPVEIPKFIQDTDYSPVLLHEADNHQ